MVAENRSFVSRRTVSDVRYYTGITSQYQKGKHLWKPPIDPLASRRTLMPRFGTECGGYRNPTLCFVNQH